MRRIALLLVPLALAACAGPYASRGPGGRYERGDRWYDAADAPLTARLMESGSRLAVQLNRPAHIAIFEIVPMQGVGLMYPAYQSETNYLSSGSSTVYMRGTRYYDSYFSARPARYTRNEPRYYFLVASSRPLRVSRFQRSPGALRSVLGLSAYTALDHRTVMNDLVDVIVPQQHDDDWTTDLLAVWPDNHRSGVYAFDDRRYLRVRCSDGRELVVPYELAWYACDRRGNQAPPAAPPGNPPPRDSSEVDKPTRRRPEPPVVGVPEDAEGRLTAPARRPKPEPVGETGLVRPEDAGASARERPRAEPRPLEPRREPAREEAPMRPEPRREEPARAQPREEPRRAEPARTEPPRSEPSRVEPARSDPPRSDPPRSDPSPAPSPPPAPSPVPR
ncbi:MAG TPA: hypothetical protein VEW03_09905 [Longimicrobiaceae bacterium]|nr:hypothetical protein [Longimicrobiaceae bacterium]